MLLVENRDVMYFDECSMSVANSFGVTKTWQPRNDTFEVVQPRRHEASEGSVVVFAALSPLLEDDFCWKFGENAGNEQVISFLDKCDRSLKNPDGPKPLIICDNAISQFGLETLRHLE